MPEDHGDFRDALPQQVDIIDDAGHEHPHSAILEKGHGQPHHLAEKIVSHLLQHPQGGIAHLVYLLEHENALDQVENEDGQGEHHQGLLVLVDEDLVQHGLDQIGCCGGTPRNHGHGDQGNDDPPQVRSEIVPDAPYIIPAAPELSAVQDPTEQPRKNSSHSDSPNI